VVRCHDERKETLPVFCKATLPSACDRQRQPAPNTGRFIAAKRRYDPGLLFRNMMWDSYFSA
jgi:hypothetical protein